MYIYMISKLEIHKNIYMHIHVFCNIRSFTVTKKHIFLVTQYNGVSGNSQYPQKVNCINNILVYTTQVNSDFGVC